MTAPGITLEGRVAIGGAPLIPQVRLEAGAGQWTCLLGPSGAGKSTLLRLIAGIADEADLTGTLSATDGAALSGRVGLMAQSDLLLPWLTVIENVTLGARLRGTEADAHRAAQLLEEVGLADHAGKRPATLSGGQRQRAALARTLMEDRPIILLDEPFSALDARTRVQMQDLTARLLHGRTVLMVTHDPAEAARLGNAILILDQDGLRRRAPAPGAPPRAVDDPATLQTQGALLAELRSTP
ncbi:ABC transporter ATP-binding protein [Pelagivirga sediminicola]|uniref:ABC transporter ATP-binding protein n=1 Tax=Pelagivirga sediminicola TaxID=2170575 RepID=A0A2T7G4F1_9RHOB|nr:ABC transporter ATP-binding protein [Pelagivirga sediminicola]PVA09277.1 ABC transporter ATP-binding protein [Pelagivirga sediminicola]